MTKVRARRKVKNPHQKVSRRSQTNHYRKSRISHSLLKDEWKQGVTLIENYDQMGLLSGVNDGIIPAGKKMQFMSVESLKAINDDDDDDDDDENDENENDESLEEFEEALVNGLPIPATSDTFKYHHRKGNTKSHSNDKEDDARKRQIIEKLESRAQELAQCKKFRHMSIQEFNHYKKFYEKYGSDNFRAMCKDKKLNVNQMTESQIRSKMELFLLTTEQLLSSNQ